MENKTCEGCLDNRENVIECNKKELIEPCPCKICLVKVMCDKECREFIEYANRNMKEVDI